MVPKPASPPRNEFEIVESDRIPDFRLFLVDLSHRNLHLHKEFELCLVLAGEAEVMVQRTVHCVSEGDFFLVNPKQPHQIHAAEGRSVRLLSLQVSPRFFEKVFPTIRSVEFDPIGAATEKVLLSDIARRENLSLAYLSHFFREHLDMSFQEYLTLLRYEEAKGLLERTDLPVADIVLSSGFSDGRYLRRAFQRRLACAPEDYRRTIRLNPLSHFERTSGAVQRIFGPEESLRVLAAEPPGA